MTIDYYYTKGSPPCAVVSIAIATLGLESKFKRHHVDVITKENHKEEFLKINPQRTAPAIVDDGFALSESRSIIKYLSAKYGNNKYYPQDLKTRALIDQRLDFNIGTLYHRLTDIYYSKILKKPLTEVQLKKIEDAFSVLDVFLAHNKYAVGAEPSLADIDLGVTTALMDSFEIDITKYTNVVRWLALVKLTVPKFEEIVSKILEEGQEILANI